MNRASRLRHQEVPVLAATFVTGIRVVVTALNIDPAFAGAQQRVPRHLPVDAV